MAVGVKSEMKKPKESFQVMVPRSTNSMPLAKDGINVVLVPLSISALTEHVFQMKLLMRSALTLLPCVLTASSTQTNAL